jgi:hypothetical protein
LELRFGFLWSDCGDERIQLQVTQRREEMKKKKTGMVTVKGRQARQQRALLKPTSPAETVSVSLLVSYYCSTGVLTT